MLNKNDKKRLYWLIGQYLTKKINARTFCNEYYYCYDLELDTDFLSRKEFKAFSELSKIVNRFSEFKEDLKEYPGAYFNEQELEQKILETKDLLRQEVRRK